MTTINFEEVIQTLSEQIASLARDNALLKSLANQQAAEINRLTAGAQGAPQEQKEAN
jgi:hypothetical protein